MVKYAFFFILCVFSFLGSYLYFYLGGYKDVDIKIVDYPKLQLIYSDHQGEYHTIVKTIDKVEDWAEAHKRNCKKTFGHYLDAPDSGPADRLRSYGGCVTDAPVTTGDDFILYKEIPAKKYIYAIFEGAPSIGPMKVYPKVYQWAKEKRLKLATDVIEMYTVYNQKRVTTEYLFRIK